MQPVWLIPVTVQITLYIVFVYMIQYDRRVWWGLKSWVWSDNLAHETKTNASAHKLPVLTGTPDMIFVSCVSTMVEFFTFPVSGQVLLVKEFQKGLRPPRLLWLHHCVCVHVVYSLRHRFVRSWHSWPLSVVASWRSGRNVGITFNSVSFVCCCHS